MNPCQEGRREAAGWLGGWLAVLAGCSGEGRRVEERRGASRFQGTFTRRVRSACFIINTNITTTIVEVTQGGSVGAPCSAEAPGRDGTRQAPTAGCAELLNASHRSLARLSCVA